MYDDVTLCMMMWQANVSSGMVTIPPVGAGVCVCVCVCVCLCVRARDGQIHVFLSVCTIFFFIFYIFYLSFYAFAYLCVWQAVELLNYFFIHVFYFSLLMCLAGRRTRTAYRI